MAKNKLMKLRHTDQAVCKRLSCHGQVLSDLPAKLFYFHAGFCHHLILQEKLGQ